uniref:THIF-type NAD/FAD binding fold domain-containing protein n=1 Tax=Kalmanozyma brasiliensis (strain GHG001) TaxID=1365824 RepID=V5EZ84_KALBG
MSDSSTSPSWLSALSTSNGRNALLLGSIAVGSSIATAAAIFGTQRITRRKKRQDLSDTVTKSANAQGADRLQRFDLDRDEASSTDGGTPRYLSGLQSNSLRPTSHLRNATSFSSSLPQSPAGPSRADTAGRNVPFARKRQPSVEQWDESLIREQLSRNYSFLGEEGMTAIRNSFVIVVGAGGVGSWAALMLLRSGISKLRLIDFDQVSLSSLNRHACATLEDVGRPKVVCCAEKFAQIAPWAKLEAWVELFKGDEAERLLGGNPTYVVDAIDNIDTKVDLLRFCAERKIKVISSMGAGAKSDPSRIQISDISVTSEDPLARSVRRRLRALGLPPIPPKEVEEKAKREAEQLEKAQTKGKPQRPNNLGKGKKGGDKQKLDVPAAEADLDHEMAALLPDGDTSFQALDGDESAIAEPDTSTLAPVLDRRTSQSSAAASDATAVDLAAHTAPRTAITNTMRRRVSDMEELSPSPSPSSPALSRSTSFKPTLPTTPAEETTEPTFFIPCVYSTEKSDTRLLPLDDAEFARGNVDELAALEDFRVRILPVLGPLPAMFGLAVATFILCEIGGQKMEPLAFKGRRKLYEKLFHDLSVSESRHPLPGTQPRKDAQEGPRHYIPFSVNDIAYLFEEVFRGRSVVPPFDSLSGAQLERWDSTLPLSFQNVALFSRAQAKVHEREVLGKGRSPVEVWGGDAANMVRRRMASERRSGFFRF